MGAISLDTNSRNALAVVLGLDAVDLGEDLVVELRGAIEIQRATNRPLREGQRDRRAVSQLLGQAGDLAAKILG